MKTLVLALCICSLVVFVSSLGTDPQTNEHYECGTNIVYNWRRQNNTKLNAAAAKCPTEGSCDVRTTRDKAPAGIMQVNLIFHVFNAQNGTSPNGVNQAVINGAFAQLDQDFNEYNVEFNLVKTLFHNDGNYYCIAPYGTNDWIIQVDEMKTEYAVDPAKNLNVFVSCQDPSSQGTLLGFGTFPWDPLALTSVGGVWMNSLATWQGKRTLTHELGHNFGLWHTFHGVSEVSCSSPCAENYHSPTEEAANNVGDFCMDTPGTPVNYNCRAPGGSDCKGVSWGQTDFTNFMSYSNDACMNHFTDEQVERIHCWSCSALKSVMAAPCAQS